MDEYVISYNIIHKNSGTVCDDDFGYKDALVVCKSLGFDTGHALTDNEFGPGTGDILLDDLICQGMY